MKRNIFVLVMRVSLSLFLCLSVCVVHNICSEVDMEKEKSTHKHIICKMSYGEFIVRLLYNKLINKAHFSVHVSFVRSLPRT